MEMINVRVKLKLVVVEFVVVFNIIISILDFFIFDILKECKGNLYLKKGLFFNLNFYVIKIRF